MGALAEDSVDLSRGARLLRPLALLVGIGLLIAGGMWLKEQFSRPSSPVRQVTKISIIPDTPPPPPPPREEKRPEPPKEQKEVKVEQPKPVEAPPQQAEQLKMEGAAGDGPSPFAAGSVTNEYRGGDVGTKLGGSGEARPSAAAFRFYTSALLTHVQRQLAQNKEVKQLDYAVAVKVWVAGDGRIERAELVESTGEQAVDAALTRALSQLTAFQSAPPAGMPQPVRVLVKNRITG